MRQTSSIDRLRETADLFRGAEMTIRFSWSSKTLSQYLYLWRRRGLIEPFGGHSDVYANLLRQPQPDWEAALLMAMPSAVVVGVEALLRAGITTQIPRRPDIAVDRTQSVYQTDKFYIQLRDPAWFSAVKPGLYRDGKLQVLKPEWAYADMLKEFGWEGCGLDPDDLYWPNGEPDPAELDLANRHLSTLLPATKPATLPYMKM